MAYTLKDIRALRSSKAWHKNNGLFYSKGGCGVEKQPYSLRKNGHYGFDCPTGNNIIRRERSKGEINELLRG